MPINSESDSEVIGVSLVPGASARSFDSRLGRPSVHAGVWGATEQKTGLSTGCRQPLDRRDVNIERLGAVP
jgi:hypothetical protein